METEIVFLLDKLGRRGKVFSDFDSFSNWLNTHVFTSKVGKDWVEWARFTTLEPVEPLDTDIVIEVLGGKLMRLIYPTCFEGSRKRNEGNEGNDGNGGVGGTQIFRFSPEGVSELLKSISSFFSSLEFSDAGLDVFVDVDTDNSDNQVGPDKLNEVDGVEYDLPFGLTTHTISDDGEKEFECLLGVDLTLSTPSSPSSQVPLAELAYFYYSSAPDKGLGRGRKKMRLIEGFSPISFLKVGSEGTEEWGGLLPKKGVDVDEFPLPQWMVWWGKRVLAVFNDKRGEIPFLLSPVARFGFQFWREEMRSLGNLRQLFLSKLQGFFDSLPHLIPKVSKTPESRDGVKSLFISFVVPPKWAEREDLLARVGPGEEEELGLYFFPYFNSDVLVDLFRCLPYREKERAFRRFIDDHKGINVAKEKVGGLGVKPLVARLGRDFVDFYFSPQGVFCRFFLTGSRLSGLSPLPSVGAVMRGLLVSENWLWG